MTVYRNEIRGLTATVTRQPDGELKWSGGSIRVLPKGQRIEREWLTTVDAERNRLTAWLACAMPEDALELKEPEWTELYRTPEVEPVVEDV